MGKNFSEWNVFNKKKIIMAKITKMVLFFFLSININKNNEDELFFLDSTRTIKFVFLFFFTVVAVKNKVGNVIKILRYIF